MKTDIRVVIERTENPARETDFWRWLIEQAQIMKPQIQQRETDKAA